MLLAVPIEIGMLATFMLALAKPVLLVPPSFIRRMLMKLRFFLALIVAYLESQGFFQVRSVSTSMPSMFYEVPLANIARLATFSLSRAPGCSSSRC